MRFADTAREAQQHTCKTEDNKQVAVGKNTASIPPKPMKINAWHFNGTCKLHSVLWWFRTSATSKTKSYTFTMQTSWKQYVVLTCCQQRKLTINLACIGIELWRPKLPRIHKSYLFSRNDKSLIASLGTNSFFTQKTTSTKEPFRIAKIRSRRTSMHRHGTFGHSVSLQHTKPLHTQRYKPHRSLRSNWEKIWETIKKYQRKGTKSYELKHRNYCIMTWFQG